VVTVAVLLVMVCIYIIDDLLTVDTTENDTTPFKRSLNTVVHSAKRLPWRKFRIPIVVMQLLTQFVSITGTQYASVYSVFLKWLNVINLDMSWLLSAGCILRVSFYVKLLITTISPLIVVAILGAIHIRVRYLCTQASTLQHATAKHITAFLAFTFLIFSAVSTVVFQTFSCDYLEDTKQSWLRANYSISCDTDKHTAYKIYAAVMIVVYPIGIPVLYAVLLWRHRHILNPTTSSSNANSKGLRALPSSLSQSFRQFYSSTTATTGADADAAIVSETESTAVTKPESIKFLWGPYKQQAYWWELVECIRRLALTGFLVFILPGTAGQSAVACVFAGLSLGVFGLVQPYAESSDSNDYWLGTWILFLSTFIALVLKGDYSSNESAHYHKFMGVVLVVFNVMLLSSAAVQGITSATLAVRAARKASVRAMNA
jgi:hypothetical protein